MIPPVQQGPNYYTLVKMFAVVGSIILVIIFVSMSATTRPAPERQQTDKERVEEFAARNPQVAMDLTNFTWEAGGFGSVLIVGFTIVNGNTFAVKDLDISCVVKGPSGTVLGTTGHTVYDVVPAHGKKRFEKVNIGFINAQSNSAGCAVKGAIGILSAGL